MGSTSSITLRTLPNIRATTDPLLNTPGTPGENGSITWERSNNSTLDALDYAELHQLPFAFSRFTAEVCKKAIIKGESAHELAKQYRRHKGFGRSTLYAYYAPLLRAQKKRSK